MLAQFFSIDKPAMEFNNKLIDSIREELVKRNENIAVAESVTAGFLQAALASAEGAMQFFEGGVTAYNIDQKTKLLHIDRQLGEACNCVSAQIAAQMAKGAVQLFNSHWGLAVTGYATPVEESGFKMYAFYAISKGTEIVGSSRIDLHDAKGEDAQQVYVNRILEAFIEALHVTS